MDCQNVGVFMTFICFALLGAVAGLTCKWPSLLAIVSILAIAIGVEGTLRGTPTGSVLLSLTLMLVVVEGMFVAVPLLWHYSSRLLAHHPKL